MNTLENMRNGNLFKNYLNKKKTNTFIAIHCATQLFWKLKKKSLTGSAVMSWQSGGWSVGTGRAVGRCLKLNGGPFPAKDPRDPVSLAEVSTVVQLHVVSI